MRLFVKICGVMDEVAAAAAAAAGADAVGFIFHPLSRRYLSPARAAAISRTLPPGVARVGVFVGADLDEIAGTAGVAGLGYVQLHGDQTADFAAGVRWRTGCRIIRAVRLRPGADAGALRDYPADAFLLDSYSPEMPGGTGTVSDWGAARRAVRRLSPGGAGARPVILAGGLTPANVAAALSAVSPGGVDVSSGVERDGVKDPALIEAFCAACRRWEASDQPAEEGYHGRDSAPAS